MLVVNKIAFPVEIITFPKSRIAVVKYDPPCPPIGIYSDEGSNVARLCYYRGFNHPQKIIIPKIKVDQHIRMALEGMINRTIREYASANVLVIESEHEFDPRKFWRPPNGDYDLWIQN